MVYEIVAYTKLTLSRQTSVLSRLPFSLSLKVDLLQRGHSELVAMEYPLKPASWLLLISGFASAVFLVLLPHNLWRLHHCSTKVYPSWHGKIKAAACVLYAGVQLALLVRSTNDDSGTSVYAIIEASLSLSASLGLIWLSTLVHKRSIRPSNLTVAYLLLKLCLWSQWAPMTNHARGGWFVFALPCSTLILLSLELRNKTPLLLEAFAHEPPEVTTGFFGNAFFWWINPILARGYSTTLGEDDIPMLDQNTSSKASSQAILQAWDQRAKPEHGSTLPFVLLRCLHVPFLSAIVPRIFVVIFRLSQPLLIRHTIRFVTAPSVSNDRLDGYWIIAAAAVVYIGMATSNSVYLHRLDRLEIMIRSALTAMLFDRTLQARGSDKEDGRVVTLMSNDISNVENSGAMVHETWGQALEVVVGLSLLAREVGWLWPVPLVFIFCCSRVSRYVAIHLKTEQGKWNTATQQRISVTGTMLGAMKNIKMLGMQQVVADHVEYFRRQEMNAAQGVRWLMVAYNASANALGMFAPVLTIVLCVIIAGMGGRTLDIETAFTTIAILAMITHPANMIMTIVPRAVVSFSSFERIQEYLLTEVSPIGPVLLIKGQLTSAIPRSDFAIGLSNATIAHLSSSKSILRDVSVKVPRGSITIVTGPVGSGKTTLAQAILGEARIISGSICVDSNHIAYCSQVPWLPNQTIRDIILGPKGGEQQDWAWYQKTIHFCCLKSDLDALPDGDLTSVGSKGLNISGGQRQRLALARALYSRGEVFVLDDSFSALDCRTQDQVIDNLLGPEGLLRKLGSTVVWISNTTQHFHLAGNVIVLADGAVKESGTWKQLRKDDPQLLDFITTNNAASLPLDTLPRHHIFGKPKSTVTNSVIEASYQNGDWSLYSYYFHASNPFNIILLITANALCAFFMTIPAYWIKIWTESAQPAAFFYTAIYVALLLAAWFSTNGTMFSTHLLIAPTSGLVLHSRLLRTIVNAPLSYFSDTDTGSTLNRFGSDLQLVDKALAPALAALSTQVFKLLVQTTILLLSQPLIAIALPPSILVVYIVQKVYLRTSRQLRILELSRRATVLSFLTETVAGAHTIRAFGWQPLTAQKASHVLDCSQRPLYLLLCLQRWLNIVLDLLIAAVAVSVVTAAVRLRGSTTGGEVGVALNVILVASATLLKLVTNWADLETSLGAVVRLRDVERGTPGEEEMARSTYTLPENWPSPGTIVFRGVTTCYKADSGALALNNLSLNIEAGQTVVVCGRTGSGKSSLLLSLLRLLEIAEGMIAVNGVNIASLSRATIREGVFITVAQEAFFLPQSSVRFNLDPDGRAKTQVIVDALKRVGLWEQFRTDKMDSEGDDVVLSTPLSSLPTLSTGQTQLLALSRALVRRQILSYPSLSTYTDMQPIKPIILLDEVTSSLDPITEEMINNTIQSEFVNGGHTVLMVTHKLASITGKLRHGQDIVVWMSEGKVERIEYAGEGV
ncbi:hypothetical protein N0V93_003246 [Gnomoniopsis smithogilvyi]|uniref:ABC transporter n=1 Tax=Gnomoniopsis smithogilvyi TaxID=1191159 RepID=A0A9W8YXZ0_9PEZI|nr:hypothetical protein N0V93_003246 [Gnomoniopsis smithogilvyi]